MFRFLAPVVVRTVLGTPVLAMTSTMQQDEDQKNIRYRGKKAPRANDPLAWDGAQHLPVPETKDEALPTTPSNVAPATTQVRTSAWTKLQRSKHTFLGARAQTSDAQRPVPVRRQ